MEDVLRSCCAGLDIHQKVIVACIIRSAEGKNAQKNSLAVLTQPLVVFLTYRIG
ncbi:hypothetical protein GQR36_19190 [Enterococcus termitis]